MSKRGASLIVVGAVAVVSLALNARLVILYSESQVSFWEMLSSSMAVEDRALLEIEKGNVDEAQRILGESVGYKALLLSGRPQE